MSATSKLLLTSLSAVNVSVASNTTLFPCMNSSEDPWGIGTFFNTLISSVGIVKDLHVGGNVTVGGTLTYDDVTNIDSLGIITARAGVNVSGGTLTVANSTDLNGNLDVAGISTLRGNVTIAGITTFSNVVTKFKANNGGNTHLQILSTGSGEAGIFFDAANGDISGSDYNFIGQQNNLDFIIKANPNAGNIDFQRGTDTKVRIDTNGNLKVNYDLAVSGISTFGDIKMSAGKKIGFATDSNTYIEQDAPDRISFVVGGLRTVSMPEASNMPVLIIDKNGTNTSKDLQGGGYYSNPNSNDLVIGNVSSGNHGMTICTPSTGLGNINFSDGNQNAGHDAYRGSVGYDHSDEEMIVRAKSGTVVLRNDATDALVASGGKIGIGEDNPSTSLHVENDNSNASTYYLNTDAAILVQNKNSNATAKTVIKLEGPVGSGDCALVYGAGGTNMIFADRQYERLRITSGGSVNIGGNFTQTTYTAQITSGTANKKIGFGAAAHNDLSNEGSGIFFSRQSDGSDGLSAIFAHTNSSLGIAARTDITLHAGGSSTYGAAPERLRIT